MRSVFDLSFRYKLPLWGGILIILTTLGVAGSLLLGTYEQLHAELMSSSSNLSQQLAKALFQPLREDDVWRAFEIINAPLVESNTNEILKPCAIVVLNNELRVVVSTRPKVIPMQASIDVVTPEHAALAKGISKFQSESVQSFKMQDGQYVFVVSPIFNDRFRIGTVIVAHDKDMLMPHFLHLARHAGLVGLLVLAILLPINWSWGQRMSRPLLLIAKRMNEIDQGSASDIDQKVYPYHDELGQLFRAYRRMLLEQEAKEALEQQVIHSERLAAVGRLAAGVAHEINNPLGGMLTAIDTLKSHGAIDARTAKTISLIERGLTQIKETVEALLVESRIRSRDLEPHDFEDIHNLVVPQAQKKGIAIDWQSSIAKPLPLQANPVRQLMINLLLNAINAAQHKGLVNCRIDANSDALQLSIENDGQQLTAEQALHLFEPFSPLSGNGHGLGLWVSYQIVQQLGGRIKLDRPGGHTRFSIILPFDESAPA